tara:strand:+ start:9987 stop:11672 length:1686 start_codon:yes stop_codon:yes gene_type:complete
MKIPTVYITFQRFSFLIISIIIFSCADSNNPTLYDVNFIIKPENGGNIYPSGNFKLVEETELEILAMNENGYTFIGWSGSIVSNENPLSITINEDIALTANFQIKSYPLSISIAGQGNVIETIIPNKSTDYSHGTTVQLQAEPDEGWKFDSWGGDISSTDSVIQLIITSELNIQVNFIPKMIDPIAIKKTNPTRVYMHYMPWFQSRSIDGFWGSHWTMENKNPENFVGDQREIASHFYPLIGPYSTNDPDLAEYHLLLMKYAGIDGILIDWYGTYDVYDYKYNLQGSNNIIQYTEAVGLTFGIVYEDQTTPNVVDQGLAESKIEAAKKDFEYIQENYFSKSNYERINENPLVLAWTPIEIETGAEWGEVLENIDSNLIYLALWYQSNDLGIHGDGEYAWVYGGNSNHSQELINFYNYRIDKYSYGIGSAYPGFKDFYEEGGRGDIIGWEIPVGINTLESTLNLASQYNIDYLQLNTWNDYGEGTMFEPTAEFGFQFLEKVQEFTGVSSSVSDLELIYNLYLLRKEYSNNTDIQKELDVVFNHLVTLDISEARLLLNSISSN